MNKTSLTRILSGAALGAAAIGAYALAIRPWHLRWGATAEEARQTLPGDELAPANAALRATHAITINAPGEDVWPWIVQIGQHRGGFYSYAWLENLAGCHMKNADRIVPEWQSLKVGDEVWLHPQAPPLPVTALEPYHYVVLSNSWSLILKELDATHTRLIVRGLGDYSPDFGRVGNFLAWRVLFEPAHFVMERKMLLGIKRRAESTYQLRHKNLEREAIAQ